MQAHAHGFALDRFDASAELQLDVALGIELLGLEQQLLGAHLAREEILR